ncbi:B-box-type zinc finger [Dillenia turbinata]|uniref:B-box-type zinc finger n=1 Tax=Dillenia turbinata TaxID=194707 RepID=A0AAN8W6S9_9MAGN
MKIQCDVCDREEASVFCSADEAALCDSCDRHVHYANKLASKHHRFSLIHPSLKEAPRCDICQERRAFLFCQEDRAILCRECDEPIHKSNEHTQKHNRFLLTGVKLSASSALYPARSSSNSTTHDGVNVESSNKKKPSSVSSQISPNQSSVSQSQMSSEEGGGVASGPTSSISEYLIETLPGWRVEDFLDSLPSQFGFCKTSDNLSPSVGQDLESNSGCLTSQDLPIRVPQAPSLSTNLPQFLPQKEFSYGLKDSKEVNNKRVLQKSSDDGFTVPQISHPSLKRSRQYW